jgi:PKD repeat protein
VGKLYFVHPGVLKVKKVTASFFVTIMVITLLLPCNLLAKNLWYFVVDSSGSMSDKAISATKAVLDCVDTQLSADEEVRIIFFDNTTSGSKKWSSMDSRSKVQFIQYFKNNFICDGGTRLFDTVAEVLADVNRDKPNFNNINVLILSDGEDTASKVHSSWSSIDKASAELLADKSKGVLLQWYTIGFNPPQDKRPVHIETVHEANPQVIKIIPKPTADFDVFPRKTVVGTQVMFDLKRMAGGAVKNCVWYFGDGQKAELNGEELDTKHKYDETGQYTVTLEVFGDGGSTKKTITNAIQVVDKVSLEPDFTWVPENPHVGDHVQLVNQSVGAMKYEWTASNNMSSENAPVFVFNKSGNIDITLVARRGAEEKLLTKTISVLPPIPDAAFTCIPEDDFILDSGLIKLEGLDKDSGTTHSWKLSSGMSFSGVGVEFGPLDTGMLTISHEVESSGGFSSSQHRIFVRNPEAPDPSFTINTTSMEFSETEFEFKCKAIEDKTGCSYSWVVTGTSASGSSRNFNWKPTEPGNYSIQNTVTFSNGVSASSEKTVIVTCPDFTADFTISPEGDIYLEEGAKKTLTAIEKNNKAAHSWNATNGVLNKTTENEVIWKPSSVSRITVTHTVSLFGKEQQVTKTIETRDLETVIVEFKSNKQKGAIPLEVKFTDESVGKIAKWEWDFGDGERSDKKDPTHVYSEAGEYFATLKVISTSKESSSYSGNFIISAHNPFPMWIIWVALGLLLIIVVIVLYLKQHPPLSGSVRWEYESASGEFELSGRGSFDIIKAVKESFDGESEWNPTEDASIKRKGNGAYILYFGSIEEKELELPSDKFEIEDCNFVFENHFDESSSDINDDFEDDSFDDDSDDFEDFDDFDDEEL